MGASTHNKKPSWHHLILHNLGNYLGSNFIQVSIAYEADYLWITCGLSRGNSRYRSCVVSGLGMCRPGCIFAVLPEPFAGRQLLLPHRKQIIHVRLQRLARTASVHIGHWSRHRKQGGVGIG